MIAIFNMEKPKNCKECIDRMLNVVVDCYPDNHGEDKDGNKIACPLIEIADTEWEWCHDCKEYDQEKHCCHRWSKVIRQTVAELEECYGERRKDYET